MNSLGTDVKDKHIILSGKYFKGDDIHRVFLCRGGFGCSPETSGYAIFGLQESTGKEFRIEGNELGRFADSGEVDEAKKRFDQLTKQDEGSGI